MITPNEAKEKVGAGWFNVWLAFDGLAVNNETIKAALESLVARLESDHKVKVYEKEFLEPAKVENPLKGIKEAWSQVANVKFVAKSFKDLVQLIIEYGPSAIEIMEPSKSQLPMNDAQDILNNIAGMMHRYAAAGIGGTIVVHGKE